MNGDRSLCSTADVRQPSTWNCQLSGVEGLMGVRQEFAAEIEKLTMPDETHASTHLQTLRGRLQETNCPLQARHHALQWPLLISLAQSPPIPWELPPDRYLPCEKVEP